MRTVYLAARLEAALLWWGRGAVAAALGLAAASAVGWATGQHQLTRVFANWPPMTPWTAVLVAALGVAILLQLGRPSRSRVWVGRGLAVATGAVAVVFLIEYATGRYFGLDQVWFPEAVRTLQPTWPGRPSPQTASAVLGLSVAIGLTRVDRRWTHVPWLVGLAGAYALSLVAIAAYLFGALSLVVATPSTGMAMATALGVMLLLIAAAVARPDRDPVAWLLARPDRAELIQLAGVFISAPVLMALFHGLLTLRGVSEETAWVVSILIAMSVAGTAAFFIFERARRQRQEGEAQFQSIIANAPNAIAVRNVHHGYEFANQAFCDLFGLTDPGEIVGRTLDDFVSPDPELMRRIRDAQVAALRGEVSKFEQEYTVGGERLTFEVQMFAVQNGRGKTFSIGVIGTDVTERVRVERGLRERLEFEEFMSRAINDGNLLAFSQPIVDARTGQLIEEELLVRMIGPGGELIFPGGFLPQAQRFGMMPAIDRFMVTRGIELARAGRYVAVNLSADSISDPATIAAITDELRQAGDVAGRVSFEITETTALASMDIAERFSNDMRSLGCRLALDDFGTGYGTFTDLRGMKLHSLKVDRSFVSGMLRNKQDESVVKMIVGIAREFGLVTTAEGIEDAETRTRLVELGVDQLQGYLIGVPAPAKAP